MTIPLTRAQSVVLEKMKDGYFLVKKLGRPEFLSLDGLTFDGMVESGTIHVLLQAGYIKKADYIRKVEGKGEKYELTHAGKTKKFYPLHPTTHEVKTSDG